MIFSVRSTFPDITVCLNSMHSKSKILNKYPYLMEALPFYYGQVNHHELEKDMFNIDPTLTLHRWKMN